MKISNIDVTLRDGGYRNLFGFSGTYAEQHVRMMDAAGIEWIEIGYRNGLSRPVASIGQTGLSSDDYIKKLRDVARRPCLCIMAHPKNIPEHDLEHMRTLGVDMLRFCADQHDVERTMNYARLAKQLGYAVCVNLTHISQQSVKAVVCQAEQAADADVDAIYLADSNGSMTPDRTGRLVAAILHEIHECEIGFHAHDNLGLAMSNSIAALSAGASFIDASLRGMGKGAGNLKLELWLGFLRRELGISRYDYAPLLDQVDYLEKTDNRARPLQPLDDLILGLFDLNDEHRERLHRNASRVSDMLANVGA